MSLPTPVPAPDDQYRSPGPLGFADQVIEDIVTLRDDEQLPAVLAAFVDELDPADLSPGSPAWRGLCDYLTRAGLHGHAARHLAQRGIEHRCPPWCISDHDRFQLKLPGNPTLHRAWAWIDPESAAAVTVSAETREEDGQLSRPEVDVLNCEALTGAQARRLADAVTQAVQVYQRLTD